MDEKDRRPLDTRSILKADGLALMCVVAALRKKDALDLALLRSLLDEAVAHFESTGDTDAAASLRSMAEAFLKTPPDKPHLVLVHPSE